MMLFPRRCAMPPVAAFLAVTVIALAVPVHVSATSAPVRSHHPSRIPSCPSAVWPGRKAAPRVAKAIQQDMPHLYQRTPGHTKYRIVSMASLAPGRQSVGVKNAVLPYRRIAAHRCGPTVASRSWVVFLRFPHFKPSASLAYGVVYVARTRVKWRVWYVYH